MAYDGWRVAHGRWVPTTSSLVVESYPSLRRNDKKSRKIHKKTRAEAKRAKISAFNAETKEALKLQRRLTAKVIDKSRKTKRRLKNTESGLRTPAEEYDACNEADCLDFTIGMEKYEKEQERRWVEQERRWVEHAEEYGFKLANQMFADERELWRIQTSHKLALY
tara:strand:+ start:307 stop:801 length:495 start_codon:yes stop_codon:yes gene_type:complete